MCRAAYIIERYYQQYCDKLGRVRSWVLAALSRVVAFPRDWGALILVWQWVGSTQVRGLGGLWLSATVVAVRKVVPVTAAVASGDDGGAFCCCLGYDRQVWLGYGGGGCFVLIWFKSGLAGGRRIRCWPISYMPIILCQSQRRFPISAHTCHSGSMNNFVPSNMKQWKLNSPHIVQFFASNSHF